MAESTSTYPRRDERGRIARLPDLLGTALAGVVIGVVVLVVIDLLVAAIGSGTFGGANGWLALVLPAWLFVEDFRSWRDGPARWAAAGVAAAVALALGLLVAGLAASLAAGLGGDLPALAGGTIGAVTFAVAYSVIWFFGVRWLDRRTG
jgi:hypothetical protein